MSKPTKIRTATVKTLQRCIAIFLTLYTFCLIFNVGKIARALTYPFIYLFGAGSYIFYVGVIFFSSWLFIHSKKLSKRNIPTIIGTLFIFIGSLILLSTIYYKKYPSMITTKMSFVFDSVYQGYWDAKMVDLFSESSPFAGGLVGNGLFILLNKIGYGFAIFILIIIFIIGIYLIFFHYFNRFFARIIQHENYDSKKDIDSENEKDLQDESSNSISQTITYTPSETNITPQEVLVNPISDDSSIVSLPIFPCDIQNEEDDGSKSVVTTPTQINDVYNNDDKTTNLNGFQDPSSGPIPISMTQEMLFQNADNLSLEEKDDNLSQDDQDNDTTTGNNIATEEVNNQTPPKEQKPEAYIQPPADLLNDYDSSLQEQENEEAAKINQEKINTVLTNFGIGAFCSGYTVGPSVTRYRISYNNNVSFKSVQSKVDDIGIRLDGQIIRFEPIVQGKPYSGLELPNSHPMTVGFKEAFVQLPDVKEHPYSVAIGKNISGQIVYCDLIKFPHALIAGTTGSGKSVFVNSLIVNLIMRASPEQLKIVLVDPKILEMRAYEEIPHLLCPIINAASEAKVMLKKMVVEMDRRYKLLATNSAFSDLGDYNKWAEENNQPIVPYVMIVLDEYAELSETDKEISFYLSLLLQKSRASGIHVVVATQRPSTDIMNGVIKSNLGCRISLLATSHIDSQTIIGESGAEKLLGNGDLLIRTQRLANNTLIRVQSCYIKKDEINRVVAFLKKNQSPSYWKEFLNLKEEVLDDVDKGDGSSYKDGDDADENKYQEIKKWVLSEDYVSISKIQRTCGVGFPRAGKIFVRLQQEKIVSLENLAGRGNKVIAEKKDFNVDASSDDPFDYKG